MSATQIKAKILSNKQISPGHFKMSLAAPSVAKKARPGQFIHVRCSDGIDPLLRRPLSIHRARSKTLEVFYKVVGKGTTILAQKKTGDKLDIIGPLGNGFDLKAARGKKQEAILVAGGMGIAPLFFLAERIAKSATIIIGAKTKKEVFCAKELKRLGAKVLISTDDGSMGKKGLATDLLKKILGNKPLVTIYACGPKQMLKQVSTIAKRQHIPCQVSLENWMGCGLGACFGCVVRIGQAFEFVYKRVCKDGPVFEAQEILWD